MADIIKRMRWMVTTCRCQIDYEISHSPGNYNDGQLLPVAIVEQCDAHAAAESVEALEALVVPENEAMARAYAIMLNSDFEGTSGERLPVFSNYGIVAWAFDEARKLQLTVDLASLTRLEWLDTVQNLEVIQLMEGDNPV